MVNRIRSPPPWFLELLNFENQGGILMCKENKYYLELEDGSREYVSKKVFKEYWKLVNRENYLKKLDRKQKILSLNLADDDGKEFAETLESGIDVEKIVETAERIRELNEAIDSLNAEERELIYRLYFDNESFSSIARSKKISYQAIQKKNKKILSKLKEILKNL